MAPQPGRPSELAIGPFQVETQEHADSVTIPLCRKIEATNEVETFVITCYSHPGLHAAHESTDRPVLGIARAGSLPPSPVPTGSA